MAALSFSADQLPGFQRDATVTTTCRQIQAPPGSVVTLYSTSAIYVFNGVDDGGALPAGYASISDPSGGLEYRLGGKVAGGDYATICVASQSGTITLEVSVEPPTRSGTH